MSIRRSTRRCTATDLADRIEYAYSPANSMNSKKTRNSSGKKQHGRGSEGSGRCHKRGRRCINRMDKIGPRVPSMKIGGSRESDSPICFAESVESWDEASDGEQCGLGQPKSVRVKQQGLNSESSLQMISDRDEDSTQVSGIVV